jgi:hypothetical protein
MGAEHDDDRFDAAEAFERFFESVAYHGLKRGMKRFTGELSGARTPAPREAGVDHSDVPPVEARRVPPESPYGRPALPPRAEGQLPAPLIRRRGRLPKQRELDTGTEPAGHRGPSADDPVPSDREGSEGRDAAP